MNILDLMQPFEGGVIIPRPFEVTHVGPGMFRIDHSGGSLNLSLSDAQDLEILLHSGIERALTRPCCAKHHPECGESA